MTQEMLKSARGLPPQPRRFSSYAPLDAEWEIPVEYLSVGDHLITRDTGIAAVTQIQCSTGAVACPA